MSLKCVAARAAATGASLALGASVILVAPNPVQARQTPANASTTATVSGPRFIARSGDTARLPWRGREVIKVGADPVRRKPGLYMAVRAAGQTLLVDAAPGSVTWDTSRVPDGWQTLQLVLIDTDANREIVTDTLRIQVQNARTSSASVAAKASNSRAVAALAPPTPPASRGPLASRGSSSRFSGRRRAVVTPEMLPDTLAPQRIDSTITDSDNALVLKATILCRAGERIILGLPDGGIAFCATDGSKGKVIRLKAGADGPARTLAASADGKTIWWVAGASNRLLCFQETDQSVTAFDSPAPAETVLWIERISVVAGRVALLGNGVSRFLDAETGRLTPAAVVLPEVVTGGEEGSGSRLFLASDGARSIVALCATPVASGWSLHVWSAARLSADPRDWTDRGEVATQAALNVAATTTFSGSDAHARAAAKAVAPLPSPVIVTPHGFALIDTASSSVAGLQLGLAAPIGEDTPPFQPLAVPVTVEGSPNVPQKPQRIALGGSGLWWEENGIVQHLDPYTGRRAAYLPWNGAGAAVSALTADGDGLWVATDKGVRHIEPARSTETDGFGGYVRAWLGQGTDTPGSERDVKLASLIEEWQGVPYKWGGQTKKGTDCSGFVLSLHQALSVPVPRTSSEMGQTTQGLRVRDELHYGDVLVFPGHVALYIGNGRTAETVGGTGRGSVGKASIWRRREVIVKRFLP